MPLSSSGLGRQILILVTPVQIRLRAQWKMKRIKQRFWILIGAVITICIFLNWLVFQKTAPDFPVIFRSNEFGINFLGHRNLLWIIPILGVVFIGLNFWLSQLFQENNRIQEKNLNWLLFFANIGIAILVLLLSVQIYFLNRW